jgi:wyosine [tRNA(Phe)-imidazoG37] synthetase (radical SAM superfamily)
MATFLFDEIIFGPVNSRRLGQSLGINLLPVGSKYCNFNCLYCECGLTDIHFGRHKDQLPSRETIKIKLEETLSRFAEKNRRIDTITFAGNGEPTLHPDFPGIIDDTVLLRKKYYPRVKIAVLSNATRVGEKIIAEALLKIDYNILKLDSASEETIRLMNCPPGNFSLKDLLMNLKIFKSNLIIQSLFVKGSYRGSVFDNTSDDELARWIEVIKELRPELVMIYTIARDTPINTISKISRAKLSEIAEKVKELGIAVTVSA